ncbi:MAG: hypothetical protein ACJAT1_000764 [Marivirga sp.]|jgi:hypothetical protein
METRKRFNWEQFTKVNMVILMVLLFASACDTMDEEIAALSNDEEIEMVENNTIAETYADEDLDIVFTTAATYTDSSHRMIGRDSCAVISWDEASKTLRIDFGEGCVGPYGRTRSGIIYVAYTEGFEEIGSSKVISFENYFVNNKQVLGTIAIDRFVMNEAGNYENSFSLINYTVIFPNEETFTLNGERTREFLQGVGDGMPLITSISGSMQGVDSRGRSFESEIKTPIIADAACAESGGFMRVSGEKEINYIGEQRNRTRTVLYGDGSCDNSIEIIINGKSHMITKS